jgi:flavin reductase (DIM6/NTAB) family NADH-FMN oxidoreductase RutF
MTGPATGPVEPIRVGPGNPFATPADRRDPVRRLRGRLLAPVTVWTAGPVPGGRPGRLGEGLTVSSVLLAEGDPSLVFGLLGATTSLLEAVQATGAFVVHVLGADDRRLGERFAEIHPPIVDPFAGLAAGPGEWGPVLGGERPRVACRLAGTRPAGWGMLVEGEIEELYVPGGDPGEPLGWFHGAWRTGAAGGPGGYVDDGLD